MAQAYISSARGRAAGSRRPRRDPSWRSHGWRSGIGVFTALGLVMRLWLIGRLHRPLGMRTRGIRYARRPFDLQHLYALQTTPTPALIKLMHRRSRAVRRLGQPQSHGVCPPKRTRSRQRQRARHADCIDAILAWTPMLDHVRDASLFASGLHDVPGNWRAVGLHFALVVGCSRPSPAQLLQLTLRRTRSSNVVVIASARCWRQSRCWSLQARNHRNAWTVKPPPQTAVGRRSCEALISSQRQSTPPSRVQRRKDTVCRTDRSRGIAHSIPRAGRP